MRTIIINEAQSGQRLDKFLSKYLNDSPKPLIYKLLRKKRIKLNKARALGSEMLKPEDELSLYLSDETISGFKSEKILKPSSGKVNVLFEDENILVALKPAGVLSHSETADDTDTMIDRILRYLNGKGEYSPGEDVDTPALCNRLDRNTSGLVLCGKNLHAVQELNQAFKDKKVERRYVAVASGKIKKAQTIGTTHEKNVSRNIVKVSKSYEPEAKTIVRPLFSSDEFSIADVVLLTGKSHQIRAHLAYIGHPIIGDKKYGDAAINEQYKKTDRIAYQLLHAYQLIFSIDSGVLSYLNGVTVGSLLDQTMPKWYNAFAKRIDKV